MKKIAISIGVLLGMYFPPGPPAYAQMPDLQWAHRIGGDSFDIGEDISTDAFGNVFVLGLFEVAAMIGDTVLTSAGLQDILISKYDEKGNFLWVRQAGGEGDDIGTAIASDDFGNITITGLFQGAAQFGDTTLSSAGNFDIFIARYDGEGNFLWARQAGDTQFDRGLGIASDGSGNNLITGDFRGALRFGETELTSAGEGDIFLAKYDANGDLLWARQAGGMGSDGGRRIARYGADQGLVLGSFTEMAAFGDTTLIGVGDRNIFIAKYDGDGNLLWITQAGGTENVGAGGIESDGNGNSFITGSFMNRITFADTVLTGTGSLDIFIASYDAQGNFRWARKAGGTSADLSFDITTDILGNTQVVGYFIGTASFHDTTLTSAGATDIFVAKYNGHGEFLSLRQLGGTGMDVGVGIAMNSFGSTLVIGDFTGAVVFGDTTLTSTGATDIFVANFGEPLTTDIQPSSSLPLSIRLHRNYPNPFNPATTIRYDLPGSAHVLLNIYNILGQEIRTLVDEAQSAGEKSVVWDGRDRFGKEMSSGIYIYRLRVSMPGQADNYLQSYKMALIR